MEASNLLRRCGTNGNAYVLPSKPGGSKEMARVWKLVGSETWRGKDISEHKLGQCEDSRKLRAAFKVELRIGVSHQTRTCEDATNEQAYKNSAPAPPKKTERKFKDYPCAPFLLLTYCFSLSSSRGHLSFHALFLSLGDYLKSVVANKYLCQWTKTELYVSVTFSHGEVTPGYDFY